MKQHVFYTFSYEPYKIFYIYIFPLNQLYDWDLLTTSTCLYILCLFSTHGLNAGEGVWAAADRVPTPPQEIRNPGHNCKWPSEKLQPLPVEFR